MSTRVSPTERVRADIDELFAPTASSARSWRRSPASASGCCCRPPSRPRSPSSSAATATTAASGPGRAAATATADHGQDHRRARHARAPEAPRHDEPFATRLLGKGVTRTNALESLVIAGFVRGLSVRDVEAALAEALGAEATVSKSTVSRICQAIKDEFDALRTRDLSDVELDYLFLDGRHFKFHQGAKAEPVLVRLGDHHRRRSRCWCASPRGVRSPPTPGPGSSTTSSPGACPAAARDLRRRAGADRRVRARARRACASAA